MMNSDKQSIYGLILLFAALMIAGVVFGGGPPMEHSATVIPPTATDREAIEILRRTNDNRILSIDEALRDQHNRILFGVSDTLEVDGDNDSLWIAADIGTENYVVMLTGRKSYGVFLYAGKPLTDSGFCVAVTWPIDTVHWAVFKLTE